MLKVFLTTHYLDDNIIIFIKENVYFSRIVKNASRKRVFSETKSEEVKIT